MAGGSGTRLWPCSRRNHPKQFLQLLGKESFLQGTAERLAGFAGPESVYVVSNAEYYYQIQQQLSPVLGTPFSGIIQEPDLRNTAPAIALCIKYFLEVECASGDEVLFFSPADHLIESDAVLAAAVQQAATAAKSAIITFGIHPESPETGYGYIKLAEKPDGLTRVESFIEKPNAAAAQAYLASGSYVWNSGMFMFSIDVMLDAFAKHAPELAGAIKNNSLDAMIQTYHALPNVSIDYAVMEKAETILCLPLKTRWNDIGSWDSVYEVLDKDSDGNAAIGNAAFHQSANSLIVSKRGLAAVSGVDDIALIHTPDAVLVCRRDTAQSVRDVVSMLKDHGHTEAIEHITTHRPWGKYTVLEASEKYKIKKIVVNPHSSLSMQRHKKRSEHWVVVSGEATIHIDTNAQILEENQSAYVPKGVSHRLANETDVPLEIIEVQNGEYVGEDDIEYIADDYGRA